ncbi:MAG: hypothetical protein IPK68_12365 [Bdellovibrionales bacterium]|nr:hypothetical protein [Bdellovibrionales bacterium]
MQSILKIAVLSGCALALGCGSFYKKNNKEGRTETIPPKLTRPGVQKIWVPDQINDNVYETGHWKYIIDKQSVWSKQD